MNVMKEAHKVTKAYMQAQAYIMDTSRHFTYKHVLAIHLKHFHKVNKTMQSLLNARNDQFTIVNTHELKEGDIVRTHGMVVRIGEKQISDQGSHADNGYGCAHYHISEILVAEEHMPQPGNTWNVQGNRLATWMKWNEK